MTKKVGIPRGLFFYQYYPLWKTFFEELGAEITVSDYTNKKILDDGVKTCIDEACLAVKIFYGHVINLKDKVDCIFIPRFTSISKNEYICPKFGGLPDMVKNTVKDLPEVIDIEVNLRKSKGNALKAAIKTGKYFCDSKKKIKTAFEKAVKSYRDYRNMVKGGRLPCDILSGREQATSKAAPAGELKSSYKPNIKIAIIGHVYNIYDSYINMRMIDKLKRLGVDIITPDMIDDCIISDEAATLQKKMFWHFGRKAVGSAFHIVKRGDMDGIIYIMNFGCGIDSFVCDFIERKVRRNSDIPFIVLTIDEHSGEAGMNTRLEAFTDMLQRRKIKKQPIYC